MGGNKVRKNSGTFDLNEFYNEGLANLRSATETNVPR